MLEEIIVYMEELMESKEVVTFKGAMIHPFETETPVKFSAALLLLPPINN